MRKRLALPLLLVAILVIGSGGDSRAVLRNSALVPTKAAAATKSADATEVLALAVDRRTPAVNREAHRAARPGFPVAVLDGDDAAVVAEMSELQLLANGTELALAARQWRTFAEVALEVQAIRRRYEAQIATAKAAGGGSFRVEIPMYASVGDAMRARFQTELAARLGESASAEVLTKLGGRLEGHFAGFGVAVQTLEISGDRRGNRGDCQVTQTITYWNSAAGTDKLSTRRETHLPAWEDPSGDSWGALLALVGA